MPTRKSKYQAKQSKLLHLTNTIDSPFNSFKKERNKERKEKKMKERKVAF